MRVEAVAVVDWFGDWLGRGVSVGVSLGGGGCAGWEGRTVAVVQEIHSGMMIEARVMPVAVGAHRCQCVFLIAHGS